MVLLDHRLPIRMGIYMEILVLWLETMESYRQMERQRILWEMENSRQMVLVLLLIL